MRKYVLLYGTIIGLILAVVLAGFATMAHPEPSEGSNAMQMVWGYLFMLLPMALVYVGVRAYRQRELGGTITFGRAFLCGLYITLVASLFYVGSWEIYFNTFASDFMEKYSACQIEQLKMDGVSSDSLAVATAEIKADAEVYRTDHLYRIMFTFMEILPACLVASLVCALILRRRPDRGAQPA